MDIKTQNIKFENKGNSHNKYIDLFQNISCDTLSKYSLCSIEQIPLPERKKHSWLLNKLIEQNLEDFIPQELHKGSYDKITFLHTKCNKTFKESPHNLFRRKYKCPHCHSDKFILSSSNNEDTIKEKNNIVQSKMDLIYKGEFKFIRINPKDKFTVELQHSKCKRTFIDYRRKIYTDKITCPYCSENISKNRLISNNDKIKLYENKLQGKFKILEGFTNQTEKIKLQRVSCGHIITKSLNNVLRKDYKDLCPECNRLERLDNLNKKLEKKYSNRITVVNGIEKFQNSTKPLLFFDNKCQNKFASSFQNLLHFEMHDCPSCNNKNSTSSLKNEVYKKYKGEYTVLGEYIDSKTPIMFRHNKCKHVFFKTKFKFLNAKIPCKECGRKTRSLGIKKAQEKVNNKFGNLFSLKGIYKNSNTDLTVVCNHCNKIEDISLNKLMNRKKCSNCKTTFKK